MGDTLFSAWIPGDSAQYGFRTVCYVTGLHIQYVITFRFAINKAYKLVEENLVAKPSKYASDRLVKRRKLGLSKYSLIDERQVLIIYFRDNLYARIIFERVTTLLQMTRVAPFRAEHIIILRSIEYSAALCTKSISYFSRYSLLGSSFITSSFQVACGLRFSHIVSTCLSE